MLNIDSAINLLKIVEVHFRLLWSCSPLSTDQLQSSMSACIDDVAGWMALNRLQLNASKTEIMWCSSVRRQSQRPTSQVRVSNDLVTPSTVVRDPGIYLDSDVSMCSQVARTVVTSSLAVFEAAILVKSMYMIKSCFKTRKKKKKIWKSKKFLHKYRSKRSFRNGIHGVLRRADARGSADIIHCICDAYCECGSGIVIEVKVSHA